MEDLFHTILTTIPASLIKSLTSIAAHIASPVLALLSTDPQAPRGISPELLNAALLVFTIYISLQILSLASRWMYSMILSIIRITIIIFSIFLAFSLYHRGLERTGENLWGLWESLGGAEVVENVLNGENARKISGYYSGRGGKAGYY